MGEMTIVSPILHLLLRILRFAQNDNTVPFPGWGKKIIVTLFFTVNAQSSLITILTLYDLFLLCLLRILPEVVLFYQNQEIRQNYTL